MNRRELLKMAAAMSLAGTAAGAEPVLELPAPQLDGGVSLMTALKQRRSAREFAATKLPLQVLSNLLWAAFGINRPGTGGRTAPSAHGWQEKTACFATTTRPIACGDSSPSTSADRRVFRNSPESRRSISFTSRISRAWKAPGWKTR